MKTLTTAGLALGLLLSAITLFPGIVAAEDASAEPAKSKRQFQVGIRGGWNTFAEAPFTRVKVDIKESEAFIGGLEFSYELRKELWLDFVVEHYSTPNDSVIDLTMTPIMLNIRQVFDVKWPVRPYIRGGMALYLIDGGTVSEPGKTFAPYSPSDDKLLTPDGDKWFSQDIALGMQVGFGFEAPVTDHLRLFADVDFRGNFARRNFSTFHYPAYIGARWKF